MTLTLTLTLKSVLLIISLVHTITLERFDPLTPNSHQTCTVAGKRTLFNMVDFDLDLDLDFNTLNLVLLMISLVCAILLQQID